MTQARGSQVKSQRDFGGGGVELTVNRVESKSERKFSKSPSALSNVDGYLFDV